MENKVFKSSNLGWSHFHTQTNCSAAMKPFEDLCEIFLFVGGLYHLCGCYIMTMNHLPGRLWWNVRGPFFRDLPQNPPVLRWFM